MYAAAPLRREGSQQFIGGPIWARLFVSGHVLDACLVCGGLHHTKYELCGLHDKLSSCFQLNVISGPSDSHGPNWSLVSRWYFPALVWPCGAIISDMWSVRRVMIPSVFVCCWLNWPLMATWLLGSVVMLITDMCTTLACVLSLAPKASSLFSLSPSC